MQAHTGSDYIYFRCRYPEQYALANKIQHPRNIFVRENQVTALLDAWLAKVLAPHRIKQTIADLHGAQEQEPSNSLAVRARARVAKCDSKLERYRAALEAGTDPATVTKWIAEVNAERAAAEAELRTAQSQQHTTMTPEEIEELITGLGGLVRILAKAKPETRQHVYQQLGVKLTYHPDKQEIRVEANLDPDHIRLATDDRYRGVTVRVRGGT
jgi:site-specific DNA recombinase